MGTWQVETHDRIAVLTFTRPPRNWMNTASMTELEGHLRSLDEPTAGIDLLMLTGGVDGYFIAHADLDDLAAFARGDTPEGDPRSWARCHDLLSTMLAPTIAAIDGQAWGGGLELALACTMRIGSERAHVGLPEVSVGILPGAGGTQRLSRLIGTAKAAELVLSATIVNSSDALAMGILNAVLPTDRYLDAALDWCRRITRHPATAVQLAKRSIVEGADLPLEEGLKLESQLFRELNTSEEAKALNAAIPRAE